MILVKAFLKTMTRRFKWYTLAANQGNATAQNNLGHDVLRWRRHRHG